MTEQSIIQLKEALKKLETAAKEIQRTQGYVYEVESLRLLQELIREQIGNENTCHTAC